MKTTKKLLSFLLSVLMLFGSCYTAFAEASDTEEVITRTVSLWDLSPLSVGSSALPAGTAITSDGYNGTKSVVEIDGEKAYKVSFDVAKTVGGDKSNLSDTTQTWFTAEIPSGYAKYITAVSAKLTNTAASNFMYELGVTDGTTYSKVGDNARQFTADTTETKTFTTSNLYKASTNQIIWYNNHETLKANGYWDSASIGSATKVFFCLGAPTVDGTEGYYALIHDISITLSGTEAELDEAINGAKDAWKTLYDFEDGNSGSISTNTTTAYLVSGADKAASGNGAFFFQNTGTGYGDKALTIPFNSYVVNSTGFSFWVYNIGAELGRLRIFLYDSEGTKLAQQTFSLPKEKYVKCVVDYDNLVETNGDSYNWNSAKYSLTKEQIASISKIEFYPLKANDTVHPGFYIDDIKYEVETDYEKTKTISFDNVEFSDSDNAKVEDGKLVFTPTETAATIDARITIPEKYLVGAQSLTFDVSNTTASTVSLGARSVVGTNSKGEDVFWKWGENPHFKTVAANTDVSFTKSYSGGGGGEERIYKTEGGWYLTHYCGNANNPITAAAKASVNPLVFSVINFAGTEGTLTVNSITVNYGDRKLSTDSTVANGSVRFDRSNVFVGDNAGFSLLPNEGYVYVPGTLTVTASDGSEVKLNYDTEDGTLNSCVGQHCSFTMPDADITVYAMFVEADKLDEALENLQKTRSILYNFEDGTTGSITKSANTYVVEGKEKASGGSKALFFQNTAITQYTDKDLHIPVNSYVADATGVSFWVYNLGEAQTVKVKVIASGTELGHKVFTIPSKQYVKCFIDFKELGAAGDTYGALGNSGVSLTSKQIRSISEINFYPLKNNTESHPGFYIDDIIYEYDSEHVYSKTLSLDDFTVSGATGECVDGKLVLTPGETAQLAKVSVNVPEGFFAGADSITYSYSNTTSASLDTRLGIKGMNDNGAERYWKWSEKVTGTVVADSDLTYTRSFSGGTGGWSCFFACDSYHLDNPEAWNDKNDPPSSSEKANATSLELRVFNFGGTEGTFTINSITVTYTGNKLSADSTLENGTVHFDRTNVFAGDNAGFTLIPDDTQDYVPGSLKVMSSDGTQLDVGVRYGFREGNIGYHYEFTMPEADVTVYAEFATSKTMRISNEAYEKSESLKFDFTVATSADGKVDIGGEQCEIVSVGALVTTNEVLEKYGLDSTDVTRELAASDSHIANYVDDVNIGVNGTGLKYDEAHEFIRYNVIVKDLTENGKTAEFQPIGYIEYKNAETGETDVKYYVGDSLIYMETVYGVYYDEAASYSKGISYSGVFQAETPVMDSSNKIFDAATFEDIADQGFDSVRLPVNFTAHTDDTTEDYVLSEEFMAQLDTVVKNIIGTGMTVIIDSHTAFSLDGVSIYKDYEKVSPKFLKVWEQVAERYKNYPDLVCFELINEPSMGDTFTVAQLNSLQENALELIRKNNPTRKVFVAGGSNNEPYTLKNISDKLRNDGNTIAAAHCYYPMNFTHQGANWDGMNYTEKVAFSDEIKASITSAVANCKSFEESSGMQVWMGEFGVYQGIADPDDVQAYITAFREACENNGIDWCYWEYNVGFGAYSESAGAWKDNVLTGLGLK